MYYRILMISFLTIVTALFTYTLNVYGLSPSSFSPSEEIHNHYIDGNVIDEERVALNQIHAIFDQDIDSKTLERIAPDITPLQDATMIIMDIQRKWDKWSPTFKEEAGKYLVRKSNRSMFRTAHLSARKMVRDGHLLPNWVETANFTIEWGNNLDSSDGGKDSSRILDCSNRLNGSPCTGIPDIIDSWADYFEEAWEKEISNLGYIEPTGTTSYLYDVYIGNTGDNISGNNDDKTPSLGSNFLGLTVTYCDYANLNPICKSDVSSAYSYIIVNSSIRNKDIIMITSAHEFFHAIQFSYPTIDYWFSIENRWWLEATATWMEEVTYDDVNNYYQRVKNWLRNPSLSLKYSGNYYTDHEYGDVIFIIFLTDVYLQDRDFVRYVWENKNSGIEAIDDVLVNSYRSGFEPAFKEFVALNAVADIGEAGGGYKEGPQYGRAAVTKIHSQYPFPYFLVAGDSAPQELGSNYIQFLPPDNSDNRLIVEFDGEDDTNWAAMVVKVRSNGTGFDTEEVSLNPDQKYGCHSIEGFGTTYSEVFLVPSVLIDPGLVETATYYYRASINSVCGSGVNAYLVQSANQSNLIGKTNKSRCFIATAAFGSPESPFVKILQDFRDSYLLPYNAGQRFVRLYYKVSPSIADFIMKNPPAPFFVRIALMPFIGIAFLTIKTTIQWKIIGIIIIALICLKYSIRKHQRTHQRKLTK